MNEQFLKVYEKNAQAMFTAHKLAEDARKKGDMKNARKYRRQYLELKAEIDMYVLQMIK